MWSLLGSYLGFHFRYRTIFEIVPMPWDWPAEVNYHEAKAFCRWKGALDHTTYRLPTEAEWHVMRGVTAISDPNDDPVMHLRSDPKPAANINLRYGSPSAVDEFAPSPAGFHDTLGNVWEYVEDHFAPLPGFEIHDLYDDFSTPCFDGWHTMIVGGSFISTGDEASYFARFHFRRHFFQHLGFRYVVPSAKEQWPGEASVANLWEGKQDVNTALHNGYAQPFDQVLPALPRADLEDSMQYSAQIVRLCSQFRWGDPSATSAPRLGSLSATSAPGLSCSCAGPRRRSHTCSSTSAAESAARRLSSRRSRMSSAQTRPPPTSRRRSCCSTTARSCTSGWARACCARRRSQRYAVTQRTTLQHSTCSALQHA